MTEKERLEAVSKLQREKRHPLIYETHEEDEIHRGTLFYVKEYGTGAIVWRTILRESIAVMVLASLISSLGGVAFEHAKETIFALTPFIILLPATNDMMGDFGIIVSSRFSELLYQQDIEATWWREPEIQRLFVQILTAAVITAVLTALLALGITVVGYSGVGTTFVVKVVGVVLLDTLVLVSTVFLVAVLSGLVVFRHEEDPNNFLIPITTAVADFLNIVLLTGLILFLF